jgi:WD40 repeat protein
MLASASDEGVCLWDTTTQCLLRELSKLPARCSRYLSVSREGNWIAVGLQDHRILVESLTGSGQRSILQGHQEPLSSLIFSPLSDSLLISAAADGTMRFWDVEQASELRLLQAGEPNFPLVVNSSLNGELLAHSNGPKTIVRNTHTGEIVSSWESQHGRADAIAFSPNHQSLATAHGDHSIELHDVSTGNVTATLTGHDDRVTDIVFSKDGRTLFSASADGTVRVWHAIAAQEIGILFRDAVHIGSLSLSGNGRKLAASHSNSARKNNRSGLLVWESK